MQPVVLRVILSKEYQCIFTFINWFLAYAYLLTQPLQQEGRSKMLYGTRSVFINHFDQIKASQENVNILLYLYSYQYILFTLSKKHSTSSPVY